MGTVWRARSLAENTAVAIKLLSPDASAVEDADRLQTEACIEASLVHPNIVRVLDFGYLAGHAAYLAMELLRGETLGHAVATQGPFSACDAVQLLLPIAHALCFAHANGVVHLDLKPENIFLATCGERIQPKLFDFGIASVNQDAGPRCSPSGGTISGSPGYMSPEQALGVGDLDERADTWGLCVVLYEALTRRHAFPGCSYDSVVRSTLELEVEPPLEPSNGAESLWPIIERGLNKRRDRRFQSMAALGRALAGWLLAQGITEDVCGNDLIDAWELGVVARREATGTSLPDRAELPRKCRDVVCADVALMTA